MKNLFISLLLIATMILVSCATVSLEDQITSAKEKIDLAYNENDTKDTWNLRDSADFEIRVADDVWWVPANVLGRTRYTNEQIASIVKESPRVKKALIGNLYEAIQLYQISDFAGASGSEANVKQLDSVNGYRWEQHTPGYYAILLNQGNCATDTNWLIYLLEDDFEEWGTFHYQDSDGGGHVINYFYRDGFYYFIDMTHYRTDYKVGPRSAAEDGGLRAYRNSDFIAANIHKTSDPKAYVDYCLTRFKEKPSFFYMIRRHEVPDLTSDKSRTPVHMVLDSSIKEDMTVLYIDEKRMSYAFYSNHTSNPNWSEKQRHPFNIRTIF